MCDFEHQNTAFLSWNDHKQLSKMKWLWRPWNLELCLTVDLASLAIPYCDNWNLTAISISLQRRAVRAHRLVRNVWGTIHQFEKYP